MKLKKEFEFMHNIHITDIFDQIVAEKYRKTTL